MGWAFKKSPVFFFQPWCKPPGIPCKFHNKCNTCSCVILNKNGCHKKTFCYSCMRLAFVHVNTKRQVAWFSRLLSLAACNTTCTTACSDAPKEASSKRAISLSYENFKVHFKKNHDRYFVNFLYIIFRIYLKNW